MKKAIAILLSMLLVLALVAGCTKAGSGEEPTKAPDEATIAPNTTDAPSDATAAPTDAPEAPTDEPTATPEPTPEGYLTEEEKLRLRLSGDDFFGEAMHTEGDFVVRRGAVVVGAPLQDDNLRRNAVEFAVHDAPEHVFDAIHAEAHVDGAVRLEEGVPAVGAALDVVGGHAAPVVDDRVADEDEARVALAIRLDDLAVALLPVVGVGNRELHLGQASFAEGLHGKIIAE